MNPSSYGQRSFQALYSYNLQQYHIEDLQEEIIGRKDSSVRSRKLSAETNRRRRDIVNKKKERESEEEKRRNEILAERKARIQDATQRFQRRASPRTGSSNRQRGRRAVSAPISSAHQYSLEDVLKKIRGNSQPQYSSNGSGVTFLQKYGSHKQPDGANLTTVEPATAAHSQTVQAVSNGGNDSLFEQQLRSHHALIQQYKAGNNNNDLGHQVKKNDDAFQSTQNPNSINDIEDADAQSTDSLDMFSFDASSSGRNPTAGHQHNSSGHVYIAMTGSHGGGQVGSDTYRQESPIIVRNSAIDNRIEHHTVSTAQPHCSDFKINDNGSEHHDGFAADRPVNDVLMDKHQRGSQNQGKDDTENSFYLKRRSEPQPTIPSFPPQAWTVTESESPTAKPVEKPVDNHVPETANNQTQKNGDDLLQDGGLRGILKKQRDSRQGVARSNSSPNIRDSLEVTKQHMKGSRSTQSTPDVPRKTVRFSESNSEPVIFYKGSSPRQISGILANSNQKHSKPMSKLPIKTAATPVGRRKAAATNVINKGPVKADHQLFQAAAGDSANRSSDRSRLDVTPTDDEIEVLWDEVRSCLLESPAAAGDKVSPSNMKAEQPPPKTKPVAKITASNIRQIEFASQQSSSRRSSAEVSPPVQLLQRQRQDQKSFLIRNSNTGEAPDGSVDSQAALYTPTKSEVEPNVSAMVNNTPHEVTESMLAYLTAEQLAARDSVADNDIIRAMNDTSYRRQLTANGRPSVPMSALSMEEQRLLQSLDHLNLKLQAVNGGSNSARNHSDHVQPHPPDGNPGQQRFTATSRGFRGHRPLQNRMKASPPPPGSQYVNKQVRLY